MENAETRKLTVFYDGGCPVCSREMAAYRRRAAERVAFVDVASVEPPRGLSRAAALARLHVRLADGRMVSGAAAFAALWRAVPGFAWLGRVVGNPVLLPLAEMAYRVFLKVRVLWRRAR